MRIRATALALALLAISSSPQDKFTPYKDENIVDRIVKARWAELNLRPAARSTDDEFLRRVSLDICGVIPQPEEVVEFLKDPDPKKREKKIAELLRREEYAEYWADRFTSILMGYRDQQVDAIEPMRQFLQESFSQNMPYNKLVEAIVDARGNSKENKATLFTVYHLFKDRSKKDLVVKISKVFLGIQLQCAQCHDHPFEKYTKDDFYSMVAFFASTEFKTIEQGKNNREREVELYDRPRRTPYRPEGYKVAVPPKFIDGQEPRSNAMRSEFVAMLTNPGNLQFARALVNRMWAHFFGQGIVEPIDDFSIKNRPSIPALIDTLAKEFIRHNYDLKWLIAQIAGSDVYQLTSRKKKDQFPEEAKRLFAYQIVRPQTPEQMFNTFVRATGGEAMREAAQRRNERALEQAKRQFLLNYVTMSDAENAPNQAEYNATIQQVIQMLNIDSPLYRGIKARGGGRVAETLRRYKTPQERVTWLFLSTLSRYPTRQEMDLCVNYINKAKGANEAYEDLMFVLLNTNEFFFNH